MEKKFQKKKKIRGFYHLKKLLKIIRKLIKGVSLLEISKKTYYVTAKKQLSDFSFFGFRFLRKNI